MPTWVDKDFEEKMHPHINDIYYRLFSNLNEIKRSERENPGRQRDVILTHRAGCQRDGSRHGGNDENILFMDKNLAIDAILTFGDGSIVTLQEKSRRNYYYDLYGEIFTFEYYNDPRTKDEGEWFKLAAQLYFYGFVNAEEDGYYKFWLIDVSKLRLHLKKEVGINRLEQKYLRYNKPPAKASFFAIPFDIIAADCIMYDSEKAEGVRLTDKIKIGA